MIYNKAIRIPTSLTNVSYHENRYKSSRKNMYKYNPEGITILSNWRIPEFELQTYKDYIDNLTDDEDCNIDNKCYDNYIESTIIDNNKLSKYNNDSKEIDDTKECEENTVVADSSEDEKIAELTDTIVDDNYRFVNSRYRMKKIIEDKIPDVISDEKFRITSLQLLVWYNLRYNQDTIKDKFNQVSTMSKLLHITYGTLISILNSDIRNNSYKSLRYVSRYQNYNTTKKLFSHYFDDDQVLNLPSWCHLDSIKDSKYDILAIFGYIENSLGKKEYHTVMFKKTNKSVRLVIID